MVTNKLKVVLDSSVILAGLFNTEGGSGSLLYAAELGLVKAYTSSDIITEVSRNIMQKGNNQLHEVFQGLIKKNTFELVPSPKPEDLKRATQFVVKKDIAILAICFKLPIDCFVTLDQKDFGDLMKDSPFHFQVVTPEMILKQI